MKIFAEPGEAAERLEELISLAQSNDEVFICRQGAPFAVLTAVRENLDRCSDRRQALSVGEGPSNAGQTSNHDDVSVSIGLPK